MKIYKVQATMKRGEYILTSEEPNHYNSRINSSVWTIWFDGSKQECIQMYEKNFERTYAGHYWTELEVTNK